MKVIFLLIFGFLSLANAQDYPGVPPPPPVQVEKNDPPSIMKRVLTTYKSMTSYASVGTIVSSRDEGGVNIQTTTQFTIKLKKPNAYLITWNQTSIPVALPQGGAVWNDGTQAYLYLLMNASYSKIGDDVSALGAANAISGGATSTIPSLFFPAFTDKGFALSRLKNPVIEKTDFMGGEECYVISGSSTISKKETFWISKSSNLILKYEKSLEAPTDGVVVPNVTDDIVEKSLRAMGQPVTDENKKQMRDMLLAAKSTLKNDDANGSSTETQLEITNPKFAETDFSFTPPKGTALTDSPMGTQSETIQSAQPPADSSGGAK